MSWQALFEYPAKLTTLKDLGFVPNNMFLLEFCGQKVKVVKVYYRTALGNKGT